MTASALKAEKSWRAKSPSMTVQPMCFLAISASAGDLSNPVAAKPRLFSQSRSRPDPHRHPERRRLPLASRPAAAKMTMDRQKRFSRSIPTRSFRSNPSSWTYRLWPAECASETSQTSIQLSLRQFKNLSARCMVNLFYQK